MKINNLLLMICTLLQANNIISSQNLKIVIPTDTKITSTSIQRMNSNSTTTSPRAQARTVSSEPIEIPRANSNSYVPSPKISGSNRLSSTTQSQLISYAIKGDAISHSRPAAQNNTYQPSHRSTDDDSEGAYQMPFEMSDVED